MSSKRLSGPSPGRRVAVVNIQTPDRQQHTLQTLAHAHSGCNDEQCGYGSAGVTMRERGKFVDIHARHAIVTLDAPVGR